MMGYERRKYYRLDSNVLSWYELPHDETIPIREVLGRVTKNIGGGGLLVEMDQPITISSELKMDLKLPGVKKTIKTIVRVVRVEELYSGKYDIGFTFRKIKEQDRKKILKYVESKTKKH
ncbi:MAG: PilZ domain-containing protein [Candidatus Hydrogenedentota bacterium]